MAVMSRRKRAVAQNWGAIDKQREETNKMKDMPSQEISEEEHEKRMKMLRALGLLK